MCFLGLNGDLSWKSTRRLFATAIFGQALHDRLVHRWNSCREAMFAWAKSLVFGLLASSLVWEGLASPFQLSRSAKKAHRRLRRVFGHTDEPLSDSLQQAYKEVLQHLSEQFDGESDSEGEGPSEAVPADLVTPAVCQQVPMEVGPSQHSSAQSPAGEDVHGPGCAVSTEPVAMACEGPADDHGDDRPPRPDYVEYPVSTGPGTATATLSGTRRRRTIAEGQAVCVSSLPKDLLQFATRVGPPPTPPPAEEPPPQCGPPPAAACAGPAGWIEADDGDDDSGEAGGEAVGTPVAAAGANPFGNGACPAEPGPVQAASQPPASLPQHSAGPRQPAGPPPGWRLDGCAHAEDLGRQAPRTPKFGPRQQAPAPRSSTTESDEDDDEDRAEQAPPEKPMPRRPASVASRSRDGSQEAPGGHDCRAACPRADAVAPSPLLFEPYRPAGGRYRSHLARWTRIGRYSAYGLLQAAFSLLRYGGRTGQFPEETFWREGLAYASVEDLCHHLSIGLEEFEALLAYSNAEETRLFVLRESCGGRPRWLVRAIPKRVKPDRRGGRGGGFYDAVPMQASEEGRPSEQLAPPPPKKRRQDRPQGAGHAAAAGSAAGGTQQTPEHLQALIDAFAQSLPQHLVEVPSGSSATARVYRGRPQQQCRSRDYKDHQGKGSWQ